MMRFKTAGGVLWILILAAPFALGGDSGAGAPLQTFDRDPAWESYRSRLSPPRPKVTRQDFGYRGTKHAGGRSRGEVGGRIQRSTTPASYAREIKARSLDDRLEASGTFAVTSAEGASGALVGWFARDARTWRTPNSLVFRIDGNDGKFWVFFEYGTRNGKTGGGVTFEGERYQTTPTKPFPADGTPHRWTLRYDPGPVGADGRIALTIDGRAYHAPVPAEHKADGASFDRFGVLNVMTSGAGLDLYLDDVTIDGEGEAFDADPGWEARGSRVTFEDRIQRPFHDFGFRATSRAGGRPGEIGGIVWRDEAPAYYADRAGPLDLDRTLTASGRLVFLAGSADSGVCLGWFDSETKRAQRAEHENPTRSLLGLMIEGPSRIGHYIRPIYRDAGGGGSALDEGPILHPGGEVHRWSIAYDPRADGRGRITSVIDGNTQALDLKPGAREAGARFDRFGLLNIQEGGHYVELYLDDIRYTSRLGE
jgi:hypothetical protein